MNCIYLSEQTYPYIVLRIIFAVITLTNANGVFFSSFVEEKALAIFLPMFR